MTQPSRLAQIGDLLTAMIAVVLSGQSDLLIKEASPEPPNPSAPIVDTPSPKPDQAMNAATLRTKLTRNIQSRIARQLGLSRTHVSMVALGNRISRRVEKALADEYALVEQEVQKFERKRMRRAA